MDLVREGGDHIRPIPLDVTDAAQIAAATEAVAREDANGLAGLINNAGIAVAGPVEFVPLANWRRQFEVNLFGQIAVTQAMLPLLRRHVAARGHGAARIVNISSISGRLAVPILGPYAASKFALEAMSDSLRLEVAPLGIHVCLIEPGPIATPIWDKAKQTRNAMPTTGPARDLYGDAIDAVARLNENAAKSALPASVVAEIVLRCLVARRPGLRHYPGRNTAVTALLKRVLPDRLADAVVRKAIGMK